MLLAFLLIPLIQKEVDIFKDVVWNTHRIRAQKDSLLPSGIPNHIFNFPEEYGLTDCGMDDYLSISNLDHLTFE